MRRGLVLCLGVLGLAGALLLRTAAADVTPTAKPFTAEGKNRAAVIMEKPLLTERPEWDYLLSTLVKRSEGAKLPRESRTLYRDLETDPLASNKIAMPWLAHFKQAMVFVIGRLDPNRLKIARWSIFLHDAAGAVVKSFAGVGQPPEAFIWDGRDSQRQPVVLGAAYVPELVLEDYYGAKVSLPQPRFTLDQFLWTEPNRLTGAAVQDNVFTGRGTGFSPQGNESLQEFSGLLNQQDSVLLDIECAGADKDLQEDRAQALKAFFARENLRLRRVRIQVTVVSGPAWIRLAASR